MCQPTALKTMSNSILLFLPEKKIIILCGRWAHIFNQSDL